MVLKKEEFDRIVNQLEEINQVLIAQKSQPKDETLTSDEVCEYLKITSRTLQNYRDSGLIQFCKINRKIIYKKSDIDEFFKVK